MCLTITGKVLAVHGRTADVLAENTRIKVLLGVDNVNPGDWVLLSGGIALSTIAPEVAAETLELLQRMRGS